MGYQLLHTPKITKKKWRNILFSYWHISDSQFFSPRRHLRYIIRTISIWCVSSCLQIFYIKDPFNHIQYTQQNPFITTRHNHSWLVDDDKLKWIHNGWIGYIPLWKAKLCYRYLQSHSEWTDGVVAILNNKSEIN